MERLPAQGHGHIEAQAQMQAGVIQGLPEALLGFRAALDQAVQHPAAEGLGYRCAGEHGHEVAAAQGENATFYREPRFGAFGDFNDLRHFRRKFFLVTSVETGNRIFPGVAQCASQFGGANPRAVLVDDKGQGDVIEGQDRCHKEPRYGFSFALARRKKGRELRTA